MPRKTTVSALHSRVEHEILDARYGKRPHKHWHYLYKRRESRALGINANQMATSQIVSLAGSIVAGVLLEEYKLTIAAVAGAFLILPGVFNLDGSIGAALSAKINHRLEKNTNTKRVFLVALFEAFGIACVGGIIVGTVGGLLGWWLFEAQFGEVFILGLGAIVMSAAVGFPLIATLSVIFRKLRINPDDTVGPIESSVFDILTVMTIALIARTLT